METKIGKFMPLLFALLLIAHSSCSNNSSSSDAALFAGLTNASGNENTAQSGGGTTQTPAPVPSEKNSDGSYTVTMSNIEVTLKAISEAGETSAIIIVKDSIEKLANKNSIHDALNNYSGVSVSLTLPDCEMIEYGALGNVPSLKKVTIPPSVKTIDAHAFEGATSGLEQVVIGDGVESIGESAFHNCAKLSSVTFGSGLKTIGNYAFEGCTSIESLEFPKEFERIAWRAFKGCSNLKTVNMLGCTEIVNNAFENCTQLSSLTLSSNLKFIGYEAFMNCSSLTVVQIPKKVWYVGFKVFSGCQALSKVGFVQSTGWFYCQSSSATSGTDISVADIYANANNMKDENGAWHSQALKNKFVTQ